MLHRVFEQWCEGRKHSQAHPSLEELRGLCTPRSVSSVSKGDPVLLSETGHVLRWLPNFCAGRSHGPLISDSVTCSFFNFTLHSGDILLKASRTQSVLYEVWFAIQRGCFWLRIGSNFCMRMQPTNECGLKKIKGKRWMNLWTLWIHNNFLKYTLELKYHANPTESTL